MLDILTIVHSFADIQTASRIRMTCRKLSTLILHPTLYDKPDPDLEYQYRVGGKLHRLDGPASVHISGYRSWYRGGIEHREYHPQIINGHYMEYIVEGVCHREVGPSIVSNNMASWYLRGVSHRKIGSAFTTQEGWYTLGKLHRLDGPAYNRKYAIRGVFHRISSSMNNEWIVNDIIIRT